MLMHPRKSSAFSSEPDDADPLERTDFAICLKYLTRESSVQGKLAKLTSLLIKASINV